MLMGIKALIKKYFTRKIISAVNTPVYNGSLLNGKVAWIVGGSGGIGSAIAKEFAANGCKVIISGTSEEKLKAICGEIGNDYSGYVKADVTKTDMLDSVIKSVVTVFGRIDILVYSSGVHCKDSFGNVSEKTWNNVMDINLKGMYFVCQAVAGYMIKEDIKGHILTVGSASCAKPGWTPYEISKNAVRALTLGFADMLIKHGIVVNSIAPGPVATPMLGTTNDNITWDGNPSGRMCTAEEIANIALMMVSSMGDMIVGDTYFVSGGSGTICLDR